MRDSPTAFLLSALPISKPRAAQHHFQVQRQQRTEGLLKTEASGRDSEQSAELSMRTQYLLLVMLFKKPSTWPRRDRQREDTSESKVTEFLGCNSQG